MLDATRLAERLLGDAIYANVLMLGAAWQAGLVPLSRGGARCARSRSTARASRATSQAFAIGRWAIADPGRGRRGRRRPAAPPPAEDLDTVVERRAAHLANYQGQRLARRYRERVAAARAVDPELAMAMAKGYHKLLAYKDEYEVARLHAETLRAAVDAQFTDVRAMRFHLAPPILGGDGRLRPAEEARASGRGCSAPSGCSGGFKGLRGTPLDPFGYSARAADGAGADRRVRARHGQGPGRA